MGEQYWDSVLRLMSIMVLADNTVYPEKLSCFASNCLKLRDDIDPNTIMTSKMAIDWFISNRDEIRSHLTGSNSKRYISEVIGSLKRFQYKAKLLEAIRDIAQADGPEVTSELNILSQLSDLWERQVV